MSGPETRERCTGCGQTFAPEDLNLVNLDDEWRSEVLLCEDCVERIPWVPCEEHL